MKVIVDSCVHGYHMYQEIWTSVITWLHGEYNAEDRHTVAVCKLKGVMVGHVPTLFFDCYSFT